MISPEIRAQIRRYFYAEHWKIGTIASELGVHPETVRNAIESPRLDGTEVLRPSIVDPYAEFIRQTLDQYPRLLATRIFQMARDRGYAGSVVQLRRAVARLRPRYREPFLRLETFPGEQAQADWASFGHVMVGRPPGVVLLRDQSGKRNVGRHAPYQHFGSCWKDAGLG
jgi:transposase